MKRRLALLLALSLTFASVPVAGISAAETGTTEEMTATVVEEAEETEVKDNEQETVVGQTTAVEVIEEDATEAATETASEEATEVASEAETEETAAEEETTVETEEVAETSAEATTTETETATEEEIIEAVVTESEATTADAVNATVVEEEKVTDSAAETATAVTTGWVTKGGYKYYYKDGVMMTGFKTVEGYVRYFADERYTSYPTGAMLTGWKTIGNHKFYLLKKAENGMPVGTQVTGWKTINGKKYYFVDSNYPYSDVTGKLLTGFKTIGGKRYYLGTDGAMKTGFKTVNGKRYYMADSRYPSITRGVVVTGVRTIKGKCYYFNPKKGGAMTYGWVKTTSGRWAYYTAKGYAGDTGWKEKSEDQWYYLMKNGQAKTGWLKLSSSSIYFLSKAKGGLMLTQPTKINGKIYFFDAEGRRATTEGWKSSGKYNYYTYKNGTVATNTTIDGIKVGKTGRATMTVMDRKAQDYTSNTNYLILVDKTTYKVCVYRGKKNNWTRVQGEWYCTHGGSNTPAYNGNSEKYITVVGRLTKRSEEYGWGDFTYTSAAYCMQLSSGNFFHSILYPKGSRSNPYNLTPEDSNLKKDYSHGCIRLETKNAEWIWDNIPAGTRVVVYNS